MKKRWYSLKNDNFYNYVGRLPDNSVDLIFTDPPYNLNQYSTGNIRFNNRKDINNDIAEWDKEFKPESVKEEFLRVIKPTGNIMVFCSYNTMGDWHRLFDPIFDTFTFFVWHKTNPVPKIRKAGFLNSCELIICMWNKGHTWNFGKQNEMHNFYQSPICMGKERTKHPTQKPVKLLKHLISIASNRNDVIFDPFMGAGSVGVAAIELERRFIGVEIDETYYKWAQERFV